MIIKLSGLTLILACLAGCEGGLKLEKPYDPFTNYNSPNFKGTYPYSYDDYYQTRSKFLDE